jgi:hypothetical protein
MSYEREKYLAVKKLQVALYLHFPAHTSSYSGTKQKPSTYIIPSLNLAQKMANSYFMPTPS